MRRLFGRKISLKILLSLSSVLLLNSCENLRTSGNFSGDENKASNDIHFEYQLSENVKIKSKISQPYDYENNSIDKFFPEYGETSLSIEF